MGILHQYDSVGNRTGSTQHRYAKRSNRDIIRIRFDFLIFQFHRSITGLEHIETYLEDNHSSGYTESVGRNTEELKKKLTGKDENHYCDKRHNSGTTNDRLTLFFCHPVSHSKEDRHCSQRIGQRKKRGEAK